MFPALVFATVAATALAGVPVNVMVRARGSQNREHYALLPVLGAVAGGGSDTCSLLSVDGCCVSQKLSHSHRAVCVLAAFAGVTCVWPRCRAVFSCR